MSAGVWGSLGRVSPSLCGLVFLDLGLFPVKRERFPPSPHFPSPHLLSHSSFTSPPSSVSYTITTILIITTTFPFRGSESLEGK